MSKTTERAAEIHRGMTPHQMALRIVALEDLLTKSATSQAIQEGWQLVPVEPTLEMISAATRDSVGFGTRAAYKAMLAAAPKPEGGEE